MEDEVTISRLEALLQVQNHKVVFDLTLAQAALMCAVMYQVRTTQVSSSPIDELRYHIVSTGLPIVDMTPEQFTETFNGLFKVLSIQVKTMLEVVDEVQK